MSAENTRPVSSYLDSYGEDLVHFQEAFLLERLLGIRELSEEKAVKRMEALGIRLPGPVYCAVYFAPFLMEKAAVEIDLLLRRIVHLVRDAFGSRGFACHTVSDSYCNVIAVLSLESKEACREVEALTYTATADIIRCCHVRIFAALGDCVDRFVDISRSAYSASLALSYKYSFAHNNVIRAGDVEQYYSKGTQAIKVYCDRVLGCFYDGDLPQMARRLQELHAVVKQTSPNGLDSMRNLCIELSASILRQANEVGVEYPIGGLYTHIAQTASVDDLINDLLSLSGELLQRIQALNSSKSSHLVRKAEDYIAGRLSDPELTIQDICEHVSLSQPYFSSIFFKVTGQHLSEYINRRRVDAAKQLLSTTNAKVVNIARELGFSTPSYFNNLFKKYTGVTPQKYREGAM